MTEIYYLGHGVTDSDGKIRVEALRSNLHGEPIERIGLDDFVELYEKVADTKETDLDILLSRWNENAVNPLPGFEEQEMRGIRVGDIVKVSDGFFINLPTQWREITIDQS